MDTIYLVYENADKIEGRGPMIIVPNSGFFTSEKEAWDFANTIDGVMGGPNDWCKQFKQTGYADVFVKKFHRHKSDYLNKLKQAEEKFKEAKEELEKIKREGK